MVSSFLALLYFLLDKSLLDWECNTDVAGRPCHLLQEMYIEVMMKMIKMHTNTMQCNAMHTQHTNKN